MFSPGSLGLHAVSWGRLLDVGTTRLRTCGRGGSGGSGDGPVDGPVEGHGLCQPGSRRSTPVRKWAGGGAEHLEPRGKGGHAWIV